MVLWCCLLIIEFKELEIRISIIEFFGFEPLICITSAFGIVAYCTFEAPLNWGLVQKNWSDIWNTNWSCRSSKVGSLISVAIGYYDVVRWFIVLIGLNLFRGYVLKTYTIVLILVYNFLLCCFLAIWSILLVSQCIWSISEICPVIPTSNKEELHWVLLGFCTW